MKYVIFLFPLVLHLLKGELNAWAAGSNSLFWSLDVLVYLVVPVGSLWLLKNIFDVSPHAYGLFRPFQRYLYTWRDFFVDVIYVTVSLLLVKAAAFYLAYFIWPEDSVVNIYSQKVAGLSLPLYFLMKIYLSVTAGVTEEILYRGFLHKLLSDWIPKKKLADAVFVVVSSGLFAAVHAYYSVPQLGSVFAFGLCASVLYLGIGRLEPLIIGHFLLDMVYL